LIIAELVAEVELYMKAARAAHSEATDPQSKAENKYDTRGLEAAYLARGQSRQAAETEQAIAEYEKLKPKSFKPGEGIDLTALVELEGKREATLYFIGPKAGGTEVKWHKQEVLVITPQSPLGQQLMGKTEGAKLQLVIGGQKNQYRVVSVR